MMTPKMQKVLEALLVSNTRKEAAAKAGIDEKTLRGYFKKEDFLEAYKNAFAQKVDEATRQAQQSLSPALSTLTEICMDREAGYMARISASRSILEYGLKLGEHNDLAARVAELERQAAEE